MSVQSCVHFLAGIFRTQSLRGLSGILYIALLVCVRNACNDLDDDDDDVR